MNRDNEPPPPIDPFDGCVDAYEQGAFSRAFQHILTSPAIAYDSLQSRERKFQFLINYADASVFKGPVAYSHTSLILQTVCVESLQAAVLLDGFLTVLKQEYVLFSYLLKTNAEIAAEKQIPSGFKQFLLAFKQPNRIACRAAEAFLPELPPLLQPFFQKKIEISYGIGLIQEYRPQYAALLEEKWMAEEPWHPFAYKGTAEPDLKNKDTQPPFLIFLEPYELLAEELVRRSASYPAIFAFPTVASFCQILQFRSLDYLWKDPRHLIYILELYPQEQFAAQKWGGGKIEKLTPLFFSDSPSMGAYLPVFLEALQVCLNAPCLQHASPEANTLYAIAKRALLEEQTKRYGKSRIIAHSIERGLHSWHDPHRSPPPADAKLGPAPIDGMELLLKEASLKRRARPFAPQKRVRLAHIVPQIVDGGHAPTKLLRTLGAHANRDWFDLFLISTERLAPHLLSYPVLTYQSPPSGERGHATLKSFRASSIPSFLLPAFPTYEQTVEELSRILHELQIDVAVFHGPDEINMLTSSQTDVPLRVLFDHGTLPAFGCFDLVVLSSYEAYHQNKEAFKQMGMETAALLFCADSREEWTEHPYSRKELGLPEDAYVLTTISNHLDNRLSPQMCAAIGEILSRCPKAVYAPIGPISQESKFRAFFEPYGVNPRLFFLGNQPHPSQVARSMHLYLNEFPFGSGLGILDALASGCPVVSMYDETGPQQARYGGVYFGQDRVIKSQNQEDYVALACRLIQDPAMYQEWSAYAKQRFLERVNTKQYVSDFERILEIAIDAVVKLNK